MHSTYYFLMDNDGTRTKEDVLAEFDAEYANDFCDENNWYQPIAFVSKNGDIIPIVPSDDWRGRDGWLDEIANIPPAQRFDEICRWIWSMYASELELFKVDIASSSVGSGSLERDASVQQIREAILKEAPLRIAKLYEMAPTDDQPYSLDGFARARWSRVYEGIVTANRHDMMPFCFADNPYKSLYGMSLSHELPGSSDVGVLVVDIHT